MTEPDRPDHPTDAELEELRAAIPAGIHFGTSTWTYPGWRGLVYHRDYPATGASAEMLAEYARWPLFSTVGIDASFYRPPDEKLLGRWAEALPEGFRCVSKVWDRITVHTHSKSRDKARGGQPNPDFLNPDLFEEAVLAPYRAAFAEHIGPFVFEFQYIPRGARLGAQGFADRLDAFFTALPTDVPYAVELRNEEFLAPPYFAVLREHGVAHVFNSWTRMPAIGEQLDLPGAIGAPFMIARALLRPGRKYEEAVDAFAPYDRIRDANPELRADLVRLVETAMAARIPAYLIVNNRAEGSAPLTITALARMVAERAATRPPP
jgi:uncharacterized protein YecE (DUF72 family)